MLSLDLNSAPNSWQKTTLIFQLACFLLFPRNVFAAVICVRASGPSLLDVPHPHPLAMERGGAISVESSSPGGKPHPGGWRGLDLRADTFGDGLNSFSLENHQMAICGPWLRGLWFCSLAFMEEDAGECQSPRLGAAGRL